MGTERGNKNFNPFQGLRPFTPEESDLFFGRERESREILEKLLKNRFVTVIGASGSGKSSLIYCGVLPKVRNLKMKDYSGWNIISFRPGNDPFGNLADSLSECITATNREKADKDTVLSELLNNPEGVAVAIKRLINDTDQRILMIVDQFEELFRYRTPEKADALLSDTAKFVDFIVGAVSQISVDFYTIISMRSDFIGECAHYQSFTQLINNSNYLVPQMGRENYREAIVGPVEYAGAKIDPELVETLINDIGGRSDQLPVLQHALMRTWMHWQQLDTPDRPINRTDYNSIGTMSDAMSLHANEAFEELSLRGKEVCEILFKTITEKGSDNKGLRRPGSVKTIKSVVRCTSEELFEVIEKFRIPSRSFLTPRQNIPLNDDSVIDLSHESLIRLWGRLREWVEEEASSVQMYLRLSEASALYQRGKAGLLRQPDLQLAINWRDQHKPSLNWAEQYNPAFERAIVYLRTSEKEYRDEEENKIRLQKIKMKRAKIFAVILGVAAIVSVAFMLLAFVRKISADKQALLAEQRKTEAEINMSFADSVAIVATEQRALAVTNATMAQLKAEEARIEKVDAERQKQIALLDADLARKNESLANQQKDSATHAKELALINEQIARKEKETAMRLRMLSISKAMSIKSLQIQGQKDLQTLLAYQAYLFNKRNNGPDNDADIYAGLYSVTRQYGSSNYKSFKGHNGEVRSISFVPGKNEFLTTGNDGKVFKWSLDNNEKTLHVIYSGNDVIDVLAVSPDASWLALGSANSSIKMIPLKGNNIEFELKGHYGKITSLIFSFDGKYLYSASLDGKVLKWNLDTRTSTNITDGSMSITSIDISANGNYFAGLCNDGNVVVWNPEQNKDNFKIETANKNIKVMRFNHDSNILALGDIKGNIELWDVNLRKKISEVKAHDAQINDIRFNAVLKQMATASNDKTIKIFNIKDPADLTEPPVTLADNEAFVLVLQFSPDGQVIVSGSYEGTGNLVSRPTHVDYMVNDICNVLTRNMTQNEWNTYVAKDVPIENTCPDRNYKIKVDAIR
ncbi:MAG: hypothetical protein LLG13_11610 [Bacteroidales bacterium]|nr:hypothetical protein [Bacteroidales bacterium]